MQCSWKESFGVECLTCGTQRSFWSLLQGDFLESFIFFPGLFPLIITLLLLISHLFFKWENGAKLITYSFALTAITIVVSYIVKTAYLV